MTDHESTGLSPVIPLGFLGLIVLTVSWSSSIRKIRGKSDEVTVPPATEKVASKEIKKKNSGSKKGDQVQPVAPVVVLEATKPGTGDMRRVVILGVSWLLFFVYLATGQGFGSVGEGPFDPYKILNVAQSATKSEIKKVYRTLSLDFHPDRLSGKSEAERTAAESQFVQISKAYKTLTDEQAMNNWLEHGHPDGPRTMTISFGIPAWMTKEENAGFVLLVYLAFFGAAGYFLKQKVIDLFKDEREEEVNTKTKLK